MVFCNGVGISVRFKVHVIPGSDDWRFFWDQDLDGQYGELSPPGGVDADFTGGLVMGETTRMGSIVSPDHHDNLWYQSSTGVWDVWKAQTKGTDQNDSYHWHFVSGSEYEIHQPDAQHAP